jgi:hypothetical protein
VNPHTIIEREQGHRIEESPKAIPLKPDLL